MPRNPNVYFTNDLSINDVKLVKIIFIRIWIVIIKHFGEYILPITDIA